MQIDKMELVIDIGNTSAKLAVFDGDEIVEVCRTPNQDLNRLPELRAKYNLTKGIISTVITLGSSVMEQLATLPFEIMFLGPDTPLPTDAMGHYAKLLGADRVAAIVEATGRFPGKDIFVADAGTAITYEFIEASGVYLGGNIAPGVRMRLKALSEYTDKLPLVSERGDTPLIGYDTATAIRAGVIDGAKHEIEGFFRLFRATHPDAIAIVTGGNEFSFSKEIQDCLVIDKHVVLKGLKRILNYNDK